MPASRRSVLAAAGAAALSSLDVGAAPTKDTIAELIELSKESNAVLMRGDIERYQELISLTDDFTIMAPFGGKTHRVDFTSERMSAMGRFFKNGTFEQEVVSAYGSPELVVLALIERAHVEVGGLPSQLWALRVTLVYRKEGTTWRLAHRHADPLVAGITLEQAAALARG